MTSQVSLLLALTLLAAPADDAPQDALKEIERTRGGRHWVDAETAPPKSPEESRACFQIAPGMRIELVAAEPLVFDPVAVAFDDRGRMFVVEYADYPIGPPEGEPPLSRVVMLEDTDGDGRADRRHLFADHLQFAHSLMAYKDGILVGAQTEILYLRDTDGDHRADVRKVLFGGFQPAHPQMQIGNPRWGFDNWIYLNYGPGRITSSKHPDKPVDMPRLDFRFHPLTLEFGPDSGLGQFGNTIDNWGHRFFCTNRNPIMMTVLPPRATQRNPYAVLPRAYTDVGPSGGDTRVYPLVQMKSNYLSHAGTHTSACGTTAYRGRLLGPEYEDNVFVCEPVGHLVTRSLIKPQGAVLTAQRARPKADFLASSDTWFRPASLATGPDGALYLADMYRLWVEHPKFLPEEIAAKLDWRAGEDRGRIWRILPEGAEPRKFTPPENTADLLRLMTDENGWSRSLAQRLIVERQDQSAVSGLTELLAGAERPESRLHALWTLDGLGALTKDHLRQAMGDEHPLVRRDAVQLLAGRLADESGLLELVLDAADDSDARVRFQAALALGESDDPRAGEALARLAVRDGADAWFAAAVLTSCRDRSGQVLREVVKSWGAEGEAASPDRIQLVRELATVAGTRGNVEELAGVMRTIAASPESRRWWQTAALSGLATGLGRHRGALGRTSLAALLAKPPEPLAASAEPLRKLLEGTQAVAVDSKQSLADRLAAIELLGYQPFDSAAEAFDRLLSPDQPSAIQSAAIDAMRSSGGVEAARIVLDHWPSLGPQVRGPALLLLLRRTDTTLLALEGMEAGRISPAVLDIDQRVRLLRHGDPQIRALATKLLGGAVSANRREVAQQYADALTLPASAVAGAKVFQRVCAKCHRVDGDGYEVGPDISDTRNRARDALLYDILDPNRKIEPRYTDYSVITDDGRIFNGLLDSETTEAVVLLQPEGKRQTIARSQIEEMRASGKSLMPEGVEKEITVQQMADLLEFLKGNRPAPAAPAEATSSSSASTGAR